MLARGDKELAIINHEHVERMLKTFQSENGKLIPKSVVQDVWRNRLTSRFCSTLIDVVFPQEAKNVSFLSFYTIYKNLAETDVEVMWRAMTIYHIATFHEPPFNYETAREYPKASFKSIKDYICDVITSYLQALININAKEALAWLDLKATNTLIDGNLVAAYMLKDIKSHHNEVRIESLETWLQKSEMYFTVSEQLFLYLFGVNKSVDVKTLIPFPVVVTGHSSTTVLSLPDILLLNSTFPRRAPLWTLSFFWNHLNSADWGSLKQAVSGKSRTLIVIQDANGDIFGMYASHRWFPSNEFYGDNESFLFTLKPNVNVYSGTGKRRNYQLFTDSGIGMGGTEENPGLFIDWSRKVGRTASQCFTYNNFCPLSRDLLFDIRILEMWVVNEIFTKKARVPSRDYYSTMVMWSKFHRNKQVNIQNDQVGRGEGCACGIQPGQGPLVEQGPPGFLDQQGTYMETPRVEPSIVTIQPSDPNMMLQGTPMGYLPNYNLPQPTQHNWSRQNIRPAVNYAEPQAPNVRQMGMTGNMPQPTQQINLFPAPIYQTPSQMEPRVAQADSQGNCNRAKNCYCESKTTTTQCDLKVRREITCTQKKCFEVKDPCKSRSRTPSSKEDKKSRKQREKSAKKEEKKRKKEEKAQRKREEKERKKEEKRRRKEEKSRGKSKKRSMSREDPKTGQKPLCSCCKCSATCDVPPPCEDALEKCFPLCNSETSSKRKGKNKRKKTKRSKSKGKKNKNSGPTEVICCETTTVSPAKDANECDTRFSQSPCKISREICSCNCKRKSLCLIDKPVGVPCSASLTCQVRTSPPSCDKKPFTRLPACFSSNGNLVLDLSKAGDNNGCKTGYKKHSVPPCVLYLDCTKVRGMCVYIRD